MGQGAPRMLGGSACVGQELGRRAFGAAFSGGALVRCACLRRLTARKCTGPDCPPTCACANVPVLRRVELLSRTLSMFHAGHWMLDVEHYEEIVSGSSAWWLLSIEMKAGESSIPCSLKYVIKSLPSAVFSW